MKVLVLGRQQDAADYARWAATRGHRLLFFDPPLHQDSGSVVAAAWKAGVLDGVDDIVAFRDAHQVPLELLRADLGLPGRDVAVLRTFGDKRSFKAHPAVRDHVVPYVALDAEVTAAEAQRAAEAFGLRYPLVVKPATGFYSAGVVKVDGPADFARGFAQTSRVNGVLRRSTGGSGVLVEQYLDGPEYAVDGVVTGGRVQPLVFSLKRPPLRGPYFHEVAYIGARFDPVRGAPFTALLEQLVTGTGLDGSVFHAEFRFDAAGRLYVLELAPRLCGGGFTAYHQFRLCAGLDAYDILHRLPHGDARLTPDRDRVGLEYDVPVRRSGVLQGNEQAAQFCRELGAVTVLRFKQDGDFVLAPPFSFENVLTAFFDCDDVAHAERILEVLLADCVPRTAA